MSISNAAHLGQHLGEALKHVGAVEPAVKVHIELGGEVRQVTQLQGEQYFGTVHLI